MTERTIMPEGKLDLTQAVELALLADLEARWENLRSNTTRPPEGQLSIQGLQSKQKAYDVFRAKLAAYNKRYSPPHVPEVLLNTALRLGQWCRGMRELFLQVESDSRVHCPVQLVEKAHRWSDRVADKMGKAHVDRPTAPTTIRDAAQQLDSLVQWCGGLVTMAPAA